MKRVLCMFVPGIKGSELWCEQCQKRSWPPEFIGNPIRLLARLVRGGLAMSNVERLLTRAELECLTVHEKEPVDIVRHVSSFGLYKHDVYGTFFERLEKNLLAETRDKNVHFTVTAFPYDWTRSNVETAHRLYYVLEDAEQRYDSIVLVGHSMGGLVCRYLLERVLNDTNCGDVGIARRRTLSSKVELFCGVGVPHYGCVKSLHNLVDPDGGSFINYCRKIASLYDMIPYSDLKQQIEGLNDAYTKGRRRVIRNSVSKSMSAAANELHLTRRRSNIFMRDGEGIVIDPKFWRLVDIGEKPVRVQEDPIAALVTRFPELAEYDDKLTGGLRFHEALNTDRKPRNCVYTLINATGVVSPSRIDRRGNLERECQGGDGTVCSIVRRKKKGEEEEDDDDGGEKHYEKNVHVKMLCDIDLTSPIINVVAGGSERQNAAQKTVWDLVGGGGKLRLVTSVYVVREGFYYVEMYNVNDDRCVIHLKCSILDVENAAKCSGGGGKFKLILKLENTRKNKTLRMLFDTTGYGFWWNGLRVIVSGHYRPIAFEKADE